jgi:hypothetical protein
MAVVIPRAQMHSNASETAVFLNARTATGIRVNSTWGDKRFCAAKRNTQVGKPNARSSVLIRNVHIGPPQSREAASQFLFIFRVHQTDEFVSVHSSCLNARKVRDAETLQNAHKHDFGVDLCVSVSMRARDFEWVFCQQLANRVNRPEKALLLKLSRERLVFSWKIVAPAALHSLAARCGGVSDSACEQGRVRIWLHANSLCKWDLHVKEVFVALFISSGKLDCHLRWSQLESIYLCVLHAGVKIE